MDSSSHNTSPLLYLFGFNLNSRSCTMPFNTALTRKLGIRVPVVQGGMQWVGYAEMASAVSNAGGLGILTALTQPTPEDLRKEIRRCKSMTKNPFAVNLTLLPAMVPPDYGAYAQVVLDEGIRIVETAGNSPGPIIKQLKQANPPCVILHKCTTIRHALSAVKLGVDFLSIDGFECAGHVGETDITNFILLSKARQTMPIPFIASGGFADGQGLAAALSLGAEGINMGTRFMCTVEAPIHDNIKQAIVNAQETDTELVLRRWKNTSRLFKNTVTAEATKIERESTTGKFEEVAPFVSGKRGRQVFLNGDKDYGVWTAGQVIGLIHDVPTCQHLVSRIEKEAIETLSSASSLIVDKQPEPDIAGKPLGDTTSDPRSDHNKKVPGEAQIYDIGKSKL
ncbi:hypothetical protein D0868_14590 [Hortaea werneckii]|uniref:Uncharacterized protein n=2 Tax=Hortaea werneckii TaxID=91943 RepID=A0A3M6XGL5_HORWE|nr:hypothetical protein D0868_14590 [Hortaea werneckii]